MKIIFPIVYFGIVQWSFGDRSITKYSLVKFNIYIAAGDIIGIKDLQ